jgi:hypothetical protein
MLAAVEDVHHRHRHPNRARPSQIPVQREARSDGRRARHRHRDAHNGVPTEPTLVWRAIEFDQQAIDLGLARWAHADEPWRDDLIDVGDCCQHTFAAVARVVPVAQLHSFVLSGRGTRGNRSAGVSPIIEGHEDPEGGLAPGVQDFHGVDGLNFTIHGWLSTKICSACAGRSCPQREPVAAANRSLIR